ncbi:MAG: TIGR02996 domain-containing protein [Kofleriaceae bacterium]
MLILAAAAAPNWMHILLGMLAMAAVPIAMVVYSYVAKRGLESAAGQREYRIAVQRLRERREASDPSARGVTTDPTNDWHVDLSDDEIERLILDELAAHPADRAVRMVYSDWCEERGLADKARYIRGEEVPWLEVAGDTRVNWRAITSTDIVTSHDKHGPIRWSELEPIANQIYVRKCWCGTFVRYCMTAADELNARTANEVVLRDRGLGR